MRHERPSRHVAGMRRSATKWGVHAGLAVVVGAVAMACATADEWPTYRHDGARSGITAESLQLPLAESWAWHSRFAPQPAWGDPKPVPVEDILELRRVHFDDVFQVVGGDGAVYFGSSADHTLRCLDLQSGATRWTKVTGGPLRLAPMLSHGRLYFGSDDGYIYCLNARDGSDVWTFRAAPEDRRVLGHGKMISLWPSRTGVLVDDGVAYFGAGIFPAEGVWLYAVEASSGKLLWRNDSTGENPQSRVSPQGYLLASSSTLYAPMGRVSPAAFRRSDGQLLYETSFGKQVGGCYALVAGEHVYTGTEELVAFDQQTRDRFAVFPGRRLVVTDALYYLATGTHLIALDRQKRTEVWKVVCPCADELILAGNVLVAGGSDRIVAVAPDSGKTLWEASVEGAAKGLSVVDGRLLASTDRGRIYCFGPAGTTRLGTLTAPAVEDPFTTSANRAALAKAAEAILRQSKIHNGYCLVLGSETGQLAWELAKRSNLTVYAVTDDAQQAAAARRTLASTGLLGARVCIDHVTTDKLPYADYFANLVVSESTVITGGLPRHFVDALRVLKPQGGRLVLGQPAGGPVAPPSAGDDSVRVWQEACRPLDTRVVADDGIWLAAARGPLAGGGNWTHQYGDPENTACSDDQLVKCPLGLLWYGAPGPGDMNNRHERAAAPVSLDGRMFVQGEQVVMAYDIYNGIRLWERKIAGASRPNASHDSSNFAVGPSGLFVGTGRQCLQLNVATGETRASYELPGPPGSVPRWGWVATVGSRLYGSRASAGTESDAILAFDTDSTQQAWVYESNRIAHNAITISDGHLFLVTSAVTAAERQAVIDAQRERVAKLPETARKSAEESLAKTDVRAIVALDLATGQPQWRQALDLTDCGPAVSAMCHQGVLVLFGVYLDGHYWKEFFAGQFDGRRVIALSANDGHLLWTKPLGYRVRPVIVGNTLHAEPWAVDLRTGASRTRVNPITGIEEPWQFARPGHHCGCPSASPNCLFFRSWNLGYYDLLGDYGTMHFGGQRPGCWINFMATGGLVVMPEASTGCMCDFPNKGTVVFQPTQQQKAWAWYSVSGATTPVNHLALNLGAPGDRRDASGKLWLGCPRPPGSLVLPSKIEPTFYPGGRYARENSQYSRAESTESPWLFASAALGLKKLVVPLVEPGDGRAKYQVRLGFLDPEHSQPGKRLFDILLQGATVASQFDIAKTAGGSHRVVWQEFAGIEVQDTLTLELLTQSTSASIATLPLMHALEIKRESFLGPGCTVTSLVLDNSQPKQISEIRLVNLCNQPFRGRVVLAARPGFEFQPTEISVELAAGSRQSHAISVTVGKDVAPGRYDVAVTLLSADNSVELQRTLPIEHLGSLTRTVVKATEDAHVTQRYADRNFGAAGALLVDGGDQQMNDGFHSIAYLKFPLEMAGKPVKARFRLVNAGNPTGDAGRLCVAEGDWNESKIAYASRPKLGREVAKLGRLQEHQVVDIELPLDVIANGNLTLAIDPTSTDGVDFLARESSSPAELIVEYQG